MLTPEQITAIGAIVSPIVVGVVAIAGFRHERLERRRDRRIEFQRDSIVALQESALDLRKKTEEMIGEARVIYYSMVPSMWKDLTREKRNEFFKRVATVYWDEGKETAFLRAQLRMQIEETHIADPALIAASRNLRDQSKEVMRLHGVAMYSLKRMNSDDTALAALETAYNEYTDMHEPFNQTAKRALGELVAGS